MLVLNPLIRAEYQLAQKPVLAIVEAIHRVAPAFLKQTHVFRQEALSLLTTRVSHEEARFILDDLFNQLTCPQLVQLLEEELGDPLILDTFRPRRNKTGLTRAYGPGRIAHILPGNIPGIDVMSLVFALLMKSASLAKISSKTTDQGSFPSLVPLFLKALHQQDPDLAEAIALIHLEQIDAALCWANLIILYGSDETIKTIRIPSQKKTIVYGPKFSIGIVSHASISRACAEAAAQDIARYDQRGCLSPHLYYVEEPTYSTDGPSAKTFAQWVGEALDKIPSRPVPPDAASAIQQLRGTLPLKGGTVFASTKGVAWTVLYDPDTSITPSPLFRTIFIKPVQNIMDVMKYLDPCRSSLQGIGLAVLPSQVPSLRDALASFGASRLCPIGKMQTPPLTWHHDGRFRILDGLRFVDWEEDASPSFSIRTTP